jgi:uncharacterized hydantoinase/oxoprolinase family protein
VEVKEEVVDEAGWAAVVKVQAATVSVLLVEQGSLTREAFPVIRDLVQNAVQK